MASSDVTLKLLVDKKSSKVLFAEADKAFVDFLFAILALPIGTVTHLLNKNDGMVGSLGILYQSIDSLSNSYLVSDHSKDAVLHPKVTLPDQDKQVPLLSFEDVSYANAVNIVWYRCQYCKSSAVTDQVNTACSSCAHYMSMKVIFLGKSSAATDTSTTESADGGGYVKGVVTYMVMDDLAVKPMSTISSLILLNTFNVRDVGALEEKIVSIGLPEGLKLLRASLLSKTVLTDVFLH